MKDSAIGTEENYELNWFRGFAVIRHFISLFVHLGGAITTDANDASLTFTVKETDFMTARAFEDHGLRLQQADYTDCLHLGCYYYCPCL